MQSRESPPFPIKISSDLRELHKWPLSFRGEQLLHLLHTSYATVCGIEHLRLPLIIIFAILSLSPLFPPPKEGGYVLPVSVCLSARSLKKLQMDFDDSFWRGRESPEEQSFRFWW